MTKHVTRILVSLVLLLSVNACSPTSGSTASADNVSGVGPETQNGSLVVMEDNPMPAIVLDPNVVPPSPINPVPDSMQAGMTTNCSTPPKQLPETYTTTLAVEMTMIDGTVIFTQNVTQAQLTSFETLLLTNKQWYPTLQATFKGDKFTDILTPTFLQYYMTGVTPTLEIGVPLLDPKGETLPDPVAIDPDVQAATDYVLGLRDNEVRWMAGVQIFQDGVDSTAFAAQLESLTQQWYPAIVSAFGGQNFVNVFTPEFITQFTTGVTADSVISQDTTVVINPIAWVAGVQVFQNEMDSTAFAAQLESLTQWYPVIVSAFGGQNFVNVFTPEFITQFTTGVTADSVISQDTTVVINPAVQTATESLIQTRMDPLGQVTVNYTDSLIQNDQGDVIAADASVQGLYSVNVTGLLHVEPSTDGQVSWAARKWVLAESTRGGNKAMQLDIQLFSLDQKNWDYVEVNQAADNSGSVPRSRYVVCLVLMAPPALIHSLQNNSGAIESLNHPGPLVAENTDGDITVTKAGDDDVWTGNSNGKINMIQNGTGQIYAQNDVGTISVQANSTIGVLLQDSNGAVTYILQDGGTALKNNNSITTDAGAITVQADPSVGFSLAASVDIAAASGSIFLPDNIQTEKTGLTGESASAPIQGGGSTLTLQTQEAPITVTSSTQPSEVAP